MVKIDTRFSPLEIPLGIPAGESQKVFYAYLNSEFDKRSLQSSAVFNEVVDGAFDFDLSAKFREPLGVVA